MSPENKQRIIGVIVLVAFIALLVPFLFTGKKERHPLAETEIAIPDQSAIGMEQPVGDQKPDADISDEVISNVLSSPEHASKPNVFPQTLESDQSMEIVNEPKPEVDVQPVIEKVTKPVLPKPKKAVVKPKFIKSKSTVSSISSKAWSVQVGSFANHNLMQKMVDRLQSKGFHVFLQKITTSNGPMVRVLVGHEPNKAEAIKISQELKNKMDLDGRIIGNAK